MSEEDAQGTFEELTSKEQKLMEKQYKIDADTAVAAAKKKPSSLPKSKKDALTIIVKDSDTPKIILEKLNRQFKQNLKDIKNGDKIIKITEYPADTSFDNEDAQANPRYETHNIFVKVKKDKKYKNKIVHFNYTGNFKSKKHKPLRDSQQGQPSSFGSNSSGGRKTYKKKGKKTYKKKSRKHNKKRKTRKL